MLKAHHETPDMQSIPKTVSVVSFPSNNFNNVTHQIMTEEEPRESLYFSWYLPFCTYMCMCDILHGSFIGGVL